VFDEELENSVYCTYFLHDKYQKKSSSYFAVMSVKKIRCLKDCGDNVERSRAGRINS